MIIIYFLQNFIWASIIYNLCCLFINLYKKITRSENRISAIHERKTLEDNIEYNKIRYKKKLVPNNLDVIVVGSGIGSLTTAGLLAKCGKKVLVLEQHYIAGGTTHSFEHKGIEHETGVHYVGNINKRKIILDILTDRKLEWCQMGMERPNKKIYDEIYIEDRHYEFETGEINLVNYLKKLFPKEKEGLDKYFKLVKEVAKKDFFFDLKCFPFEFVANYIKYLDPNYYKYSIKTAYETIKELIDDEELIAVLCGQFGDYGKTPKTASFFIHASIVNHYLEGGWFPKGGTGNIANYIIKTIKENGGEVLVAKGVKQILVDDDNDDYGVKMDNGDVIQANSIVSGVGIKNTFTKLLENVDYSNEYDKLLDNIDSSVQHMYCFVKLEGTPEELKLRSSNLWIYPHKDYDKLMNDFLEDPFEAPMPLFMGFSCMKDSEWNKKYKGYSNAIILTVAKKDFFSQWEDKKSTKRGEDYEGLKNLIGERMLEEGLYKYFPQTRGKVLDYNIASPLTTQFYIGAADGESYGLDMNEYRLINGGKLRPKTSINNLFLTGQDICTLGVTGAMMGGVLTANVIMKYDNLLDICCGNNIIKDIIKVENKNK